MIELVVVVGISVILTLSASALFLTFLINNTRSTAIQTIKEEGTYALSQMSFLLRNAITLEPNSQSVTCASDMDEITFTSLDGGVTTLEAQVDGTTTRIASNSGIFLTSDRVTVTSGPEFDCDAASKHITITFSLRKGTQGVDTAKEIVEETFTTGVSLRSM